MRLVEIRKSVRRMLKSLQVNNLLSRGVTKFAIDMDHAIYDSIGIKPDGGRPNVVFSPLSVVSTLAMVLLGSAGVTFQQVSKILGLESGVDISGHSEIVHLMLGLVFNTIRSRPGGVGPEVTMANGMFVQVFYKLRFLFPRNGDVISRLIKLMKRMYIETERLSYPRRVQGDQPRGLR